MVEQRRKAGYYEPENFPAMQEGAGATSIA
jgi:hypothetical protein